MNPELAWGLRTLARHIQEPLWGSNCPVMEQLSLQEAMAHAEEVHPAQIAQGLTLHVQAMGLLMPSMQLRLLNAAAGGVEALQDAILRVPEGSLMVLRPVLLFLQQWLLRQQDPQQLHTLSYLWGTVLFPSLVQAGLTAKAASLCAALMSNALNIFRPTLNVKLPEATTSPTISPASSPNSSWGGSSTSSSTPASPRTHAPLLSQPTSPPHKHTGKQHLEPLDQAHSPTSTGSAEAWLVPAGVEELAAQPLPTKPRHSRNHAWSLFTHHTTISRSDELPSDFSPSPRANTGRPPLHIGACGAPLSPTHPYDPTSTSHSHYTTAMERAAAALGRGTTPTSPRHSPVVVPVLTSSTPTTPEPPSSSDAATDEPWAADPAWSTVLSSLVSNTVSSCLFSDDDDDDDHMCVDVHHHVITAVPAATPAATPIPMCPPLPLSPAPAAPIPAPVAALPEGVSVCVLSIARKHISLQRSCSAPCTKSLLAGCDADDCDDDVLDVATALDQTSPRLRFTPVVVRTPLPPSPLSAPPNPAAPPLPGGCLALNETAQWQHPTCFPVTCGM